MGRRWPAAAARVEDVAGTEGVIVAEKKGAKPLLISFAKAVYKEGVTLEKCTVQEMKAKLRKQYLKRKGKEEEQETSECNKTPKKERESGKEKKAAEEDDAKGKQKKRKREVEDNETKGKKRKRKDEEEGESDDSNDGDFKPKVPKYDETNFMVDDKHKVTIFAFFLNKRKGRNSWKRNCKSFPKLRHLSLRDPSSKRKEEKTS